MNLLKAASIYAMRNVPPDEYQAYGLRVLVMRCWPRGIRKTDIDLWIPEAAPSQSLLQQHRAKALSWEAFEAAYQAEQMQARMARLVRYLQGQRVVQVVEASPISALQQLAEEQQITLLCWEAGEQCHRYRLKHLVEGTLFPSPGA